MDWLLSNLLPIGVIGGFLLLGSFVRVSFVKPIPKLMAVGCVLLLIVGIGVGVVAFSTPGREEADTVTPDDSGKPVLVNSAIERLQSPWDSEKREGDWPVSETLAEISDAAYLPPVDAYEKYAELGFVEIMPIVEGSMIGYVISGDDVTVIVFRGTDFAEVSDWLANLDRSTADTPHGPIHRGFDNAYFSMKPQIDQIIAERNTKHVWITGHSLGGALALICAYDFLENNKREIDGVITFGQPMVARAKLASYIDKMLVGQYARFVNGADIVPRVPPSYDFCGTLVWFTDEGIKRSKPKEWMFVGAGPDDKTDAIDGEIEIEPLSEAEFEALQSQLRTEKSESKQPPDGIPVYEGNFGLIQDHAMHLYLDKIRANLGISVEN